MGRRKISIQPITDPKLRLITFHKRKRGLIKKAAEMAVLCNVNLLLIFEDGFENLIQFSKNKTSSMESFLNQCNYHSVLKLTSEDYPSFEKMTRYRNSVMTTGQEKFSYEDEMKERNLNQQSDSESDTREKSGWSGSNHSDLKQEWDIKTEAQSLSTTIDPNRSKKKRKNSKLPRKKQARKYSSDEEEDDSESESIVEKEEEEEMGNSLCLKKEEEGQDSGQNFKLENKIQELPEKVPPIENEHISLNKGFPEPQFGASYNPYPMMMGNMGAMPHQINPFYPFSQFQNPAEFKEANHSLGMKDIRQMVQNENIQKLQCMYEKFIGMTKRPNPGLINPQNPGMGMMTHFLPNSEKVEPDNGSLVDKSIKIQVNPFDGDGKGTKKKKAKGSEPSKKLKKS